ncbi:MAG: hypothetical protein ABI831_20495 [Betaproteobacteria bacterium]
MNEPVQTFVANTQTRQHVDNGVARDNLFLDPELGVRRRSGLGKDDGHGEIPTDELRGGIRMHLRCNRDGGDRNQHAHHAADKPDAPALAFDKGLGDTRLR